MELMEIRERTEFKKMWRDRIDEIILRAGLDMIGCMASFYVYAKQKVLVNLIKFVPLCFHVETSSAAH